MAIEVLMPALSPTMTEGNLTRWLKKEGDKVSPGDVIAEIETDKATMEVETIDEGVLAKIIIQEGVNGVKVNQLIAIISEEDDAADAIDVLLAKKDIKPAVVEQNKAVAVQEQAVAKNVDLSPVPSGLKIFASPLAKRIAKDRGIDLTNITGTGPKGRIIKADLEKINKTSQQKAARVFPLSKLLGHSGIRRVIAKRLTESKQQAPHFYLSMDCNFDALLAAREQINKSYGAKDGHQPRISVNDFIIKAASLALSRFPNANASWQEDGMVLYNNVDISVAVAVDEGLITPILHNADKKDILTISKEMKLLVSKAKEGTLRPDEFQGGGFTISNLGMFGVKQFSAIVNPPQACILAVGSAEEKPVIINGAVACAKVTNFTLSCDHRVIDGVLAAKLLACIKDYLENPILMFI